MLEVYIVTGLLERFVVAVGEEETKHVTEAESFDDAAYVS